MWIMAVPSLEGRSVHGAGAGAKVAKTASVLRFSHKVTAASDAGPHRPCLFRPLSLGTEDAELILREAKRRGLILAAEDMGHRDLSPDACRHEPRDAVLTAALSRCQTGADRRIPSMAAHGAYDTLLTDVSGGIMTMTLNRPERLNAFTDVMARELIAAFDAADADDAVRVVVVTGAGRAFCAGADLGSGGDTFDRAAQGRGDDPADPRNRDGGGTVTLRIFKCLKPVIAAVNGPAVGIGATMQLAMDVRLASETARFGFVFARRGITPEAASAWFLPRLVGMSQALEWCLTGRVFPAEEARQGGLVRSVHAPDALLPAAYALAREIADNTAPVSVAMTRQMLWRLSAARDPMAAHRVDSRAIFERGASADAQEGVTSFLEKRPAVFPCTVAKDMPAFFPWWEEEVWK
jgi:enoyl-CoA hydratase/carnithine racemase